MDPCTLQQYNITNTKLPDNQFRHGQNLSTNPEVCGFLQYGHCDKHPTINNKIADRGHLRHPFHRAPRQETPEAHSNRIVQPNPSCRQIWAASLIESTEKQARRNEETERVRGLPGSWWGRWGARPPSTTASSSPSTLPRCLGSVRRQDWRRAAAGGAPPTLPRYSRQAPCRYRDYSSIQLRYSYLGSWEVSVAVARSMRIGDGEAGNRAELEARRGGGPTSPASAPPPPPRAARERGKGVWEGRGSMGSDAAGSTYYNQWAIWAINSLKMFWTLNSLKIVVDIWAIKQKSFNTRTIPSTIHRAKKF
jgi:hypothetical protein